jgi:hypothetical protein
MEPLKISCQFYAPSYVISYEQVGKFVQLLRTQYPGQTVALADIEMDCALEDLIAPLMFFHEGGFITYDIFAETVCGHKDVLPVDQIQPVLTKQLV